MITQTTRSHPFKPSFLPPIPNLFDFTLPPHLEADSPPEARGLARDEVRLMISAPEVDEIIHTDFRSLPAYLRAGDVFVINTSGTMKAALNATYGEGLPLEVHLSTQLPDGSWTLELRQLTSAGTKPHLSAKPGERVRLPLGGTATLIRPYRKLEMGVRLWVADLDLPLALHPYLEAFGFPIRYSYVKRPWPIDTYQTVYATEPGSAEMPSAGRAFSHTLMTKLVAQGVQFAPIILHTGVASLETHEAPYEEYYRVGALTAQLVNDARERGHRVIAVGTTVVRALETLVEKDGTITPGEGWTDLMITPERGISSVDGLLTGFHEPEATHLAMLEALVGREHLRQTYAAALSARYLWHEFGDLHLLLADRTQKVL